MSTGPAPTGPLHLLSARDLLGAIAARQVSAVEATTAALDRIDAVNPALGAIVTLDPERALREAAEADRASVHGEATGPLHGLPIAVKDLHDTVGMRTTYGSPIYADHVPAADGPLVVYLRGAGAIVLGKTNTPEFGAGSQTFNPVFGATGNPYRPDLTAGGSSGGAAAAVASGMLALADGTDLAASIRNPAAFCGVVGLRPTPGRMPFADPVDRWEGLSVAGPIAREVADLGLMLPRRAEAGPPRPRPTDPTGLRIAWSAAGGGLPIAPPVADVLVRARGRLEAAGCLVEDVRLELADADRVFDVLRALRFARRLGGLLAAERGRLKETVVWNVERGLALGGEEIAAAQALRGRLFLAMEALLRDHDLLALPAAQVQPFPIDEPWPDAGAGASPSSYLDWLRVCSRITVTAHPAVSLPAGLDRDGLPVGLQLVGGHGDDESLLAGAAAVEAALGTIPRPDPGSPEGGGSR